MFLLQLVLLMVMVAGPHDLHMSQSRVTIANGTMQWRVRVFSDDIEQALRAHARRPAYTIGANAATDSLFVAYFNARVQVTVGNRRVVARLVEGGSDVDPAGADMRWWLLQLDVGRNSRGAAIRQSMLTELFRDQQNLVVLTGLAGSSKQALYFSTGDEKPQPVRF